MKSLTDFLIENNNSISSIIFEGKTFTEVKREVLKALGITSWEKANYKIGICPKLNVLNVAKPNPKSYNPNRYGFMYNDEFDKIVLSPNYSYLNKSDYESKVINSLNKLSSIEGCSYLIVKDIKHFNELSKEEKTSQRADDHYPEVIISIPKSGNKTELPEVPYKENPGNEEEAKNNEVEKTKTKEKSSIKFWCTGAGSMSVEYIAYGSMDNTFKPDFERISERIGEERFTQYYTKLQSKTFTSYKALYRYLEKKWDSRYSKFSMASEEEIIDAMRDSNYFVKTF